MEASKRFRLKYKRKKIPFLSVLLNELGIIMNRIILVMILLLNINSVVCSKNLFSKTNILIQESEETFPFKPSDGILVDAFPDTNSFLNRIFPIDDKGYAEFPIVGKIQVSKMTKKQLTDFIKTTYKNYLRYSDIYVKPMVRISLLGGFAKPGLYYIDWDNSLWDAVYKAGGTLNEDGIYDMEWKRDNKSKTDEIVSLYERGISLRAIGFKSGDQILTPSPNARTFWGAISDIMPILTFATTVVVVYNTYQRDSILLSR